MLKIVTVYKCDACGALSDSDADEHICSGAKELGTAHNSARDEILPGDCPVCHGCGNVEVSHANMCFACAGTGKTSPVA